MYVINLAVIMLKKGVESYVISLEQALSSVKGQRVLLQPLPQFPHCIFSIIMGIFTSEQPKLQSHTS